MSETRYQISEMSKLLQVEPHVLRYWEEELGLNIGRNEMGHRCYTDKDLQRFFRVKELKKDGMQLREIKEQFVEKDAKIVDFCGKDTNTIQEKYLSIEKEQEAVSLKEQAFYQIMERMIDRISNGDPKEGRYRKLDEVIRQHQQSRKMVAATEEVRGSHWKKHKKRKKESI